MTDVCPVSSRISAAAHHYGAGTAQSARRAPFSGRFPSTYKATPPSMSQCSGSRVGGTYAGASDTAISSRAQVATARGDGNPQQPFRLALPLREARGFSFTACCIATPRHHVTSSGSTARFSHQLNLQLQNSEPSYSAQTQDRLKIHIRFCRAYA